LSSSKVIDEETAEALKNEIFEEIIPELSRQAALLPIEETNELAIDWFNGRRTPDADQSLKGAVIGLNLGTDAPRFFRAIAEATCFGAKSIVERMIDEGVPVKGLIGIGGVAKKSAFIMQMMADVIGMPIKIHQHTHTCALGAAMFAAVVADLHPNVEAAMHAMGGGFDVVYEPNAELSAVYAKRYKQYKGLGDFITFQTRQIEQSLSA
jgi:L-ribulokinase